MNHANLIQDLHDAANSDVFVDTSFFVEDEAKQYNAQIQAVQDTIAQAVTALELLSNHPVTIDMRETLQLQVDYEDEDGPTICGPIKGDIPTEPNDHGTPLKCTIMCTDQNGNIITYSPDMSGQDLELDDYPGRTHT